MRKLIIVIIMAALGRIVCASENRRPFLDSSDFQGFICFNPVRIFFDEVSFFYFHRLTERYSMGLSLGYKRGMPIWSDFFNGGYLIGAEDPHTYINLKSYGPVFRVINEFYAIVSKDEIVYFALHGVYRHIEAEDLDVYHTYGFMSPSEVYSVNVSRKNNIYGMQVHAGYRILNDDFIPWMDIYLGLGYKYENYTTTINYTSSYYALPEAVIPELKDNMTNYSSVTVHLGVRIGFGYLRNVKKVRTKL